MDKQAAVAEIMHDGPVIPVLTVDDVERAGQIARAIHDGGIRVLEITLRTPTALAVIKAMREAVPDAIIGAGTIVRPEQLAEAQAAGAVFAVCPGFTETLLDAAESVTIPLLPGAGSASEIMRLLERGYRHQKFFPAQPAGGAAFLKSIASPLPEARFCPTGGISLNNASDYLAAPNVICVGGSWMAPADAVREGDWPRITDLARASSELTMRA